MGLLDKRITPAPNDLMEDLFPGFKEKLIGEQQQKKRMRHKKKIKTQNGKGIAKEEPEKKEVIRGILGEIIR